MEGCGEIIPLIVDPFDNRSTDFNEPLFFLVSQWGTLTSLFDIMVINVKQVLTLRWSPCLKKETVWKCSTSRIEFHSIIPCPDRSDSVCAPMLFQQGGPGDCCLLSFTPAKSQNRVSERIGSTMAAVLYRPAFGESCIESQKSFWNSSNFIIILTFVFL